MLANHEQENIKAFLRASHAKATQKAYATDLRIFQDWCWRNQYLAFPASPVTVAAFFSAQANHNLKPVTLSRRAAAIHLWHARMNQPSPIASELVKSTLRGIRRTFGCASSQKQAATIDVLAEMAKYFPNSLIGLRDRALLFLGFAGALRRSELAKIRVADLTRCPEGFILKIARSKTDQEGLGQAIAIYNGLRLNIVAAIDVWTEAAGITEGFLFRSVTKGGLVSSQHLSTKTIAQIIKKYVALAGYDAASFSGHSLRAGFLTSAAQKGASMFKMMEVSRHKSTETLKKYVRNSELFLNHAGAAFL